MNQELNGIAEVRRQVGRLFAPSAAPAGRVSAPRWSSSCSIDLQATGTASSGSTVSRPSSLRTRLAAEARFTFEPGGQLELSPAPSASPRELTAALRRLLAATDDLLARHEIGTASRPVDVWHQATALGLQTPGGRYLAMQRHFDAIGPAGRQMMRRTAALQITIDRLAGEAGRRQWLLANHMAPALALAFGRPAAEHSQESRLRIWRDVDPSRTGFDGVQVDGRFPATAYATFALAAEVMPIRRRASGPSAAQRHTRLPFRDWARMRGARPDGADVAHHLSTLFPPVRPRGRYLEIRFCDAQPTGWLDVPISMFAVLLGDHRATAEALDVVGRAPRILQATGRLRPPAPTSGWGLSHGSSSGSPPGMGASRTRVASRNRA